jgi:hypothetical protein
MLVFAGKVNVIFFADRLQDVNALMRDSRVGWHIGQEQLTGEAVL